MRIVVKTIALLMMTVFACISCKKKDSIETVQILIQNRTESSIRVTLYPKLEYLSGDLYLRFDIGGGYNKTEFLLSPNDKGYYVWSEVLVESGDLSVKPYALAAKWFDSICISTTNKDHLIKFTHESVTGYSENIFSENSTWDYKMVEWDVSDMKARTAYYHCYRFLILEDNFVISSEEN